MTDRPKFSPYREGPMRPFDEAIYKAAKRFWADSREIAAEQQNAITSPIPHVEMDILKTDNSPHTGTLLDQHLKP